jgi:heme exporter protein A
MSGTAVAVAVSASGLTHRYGRRATGVERLEFSFEGPGVVAVTGVNGSGKSTLLRIIAGLLRASTGDVQLRVDGRDVSRALRRTRVGLATPELAFYEEFTGTENLEFSAETRGLEAPRDAAAKALSRVGLAARGKDRVAAYSSGMKQRLRLAFALLHEPPLLLLDEPGSHLDDEGRTAVREVVRAHGERGLVLLATNDPQEVQLAERSLELVARGLGDPA